MIRLKKFYYFFFSILLIMVILEGCSEEPVSLQAQPEKKIEGTIVAVGDSLTEGLGVAEESAYPALLERKLRENGYSFKVVNAGISGETSSGTLSRINWVLTLKPDIVILVTGANDGLRGIDPQLVKANLNQIIKTLKEANVIVVLGGMQMVQNLGKDYTRAFADVYPQVAGREDVVLIPFFLAGVAADPELNQPDGIHPTAAGYRKVAETVYPYVVEAIKKWKTQKDDHRN
jgi:acyl-CoA thioesterase-1